MYIHKQLKENEDPEFQRMTDDEIVKEDAVFVKLLQLLRQ